MPRNPTTAESAFDAMERLSIALDEKSPREMLDTVLEARGGFAQALAAYAEIASVIIELTADLGVPASALLAIMLHETFGLNAMLGAGRDVPEADTRRCFAILTRLGQTLMTAARQGEHTMQ